MTLITDPNDLHKLDEYNEPPGGKCAFTRCGRDAVVELNLQIAQLGRVQPVKLCGLHQMELADMTAVPENEELTITERCEIVFEGKTLRVEDGRLIREDPNG